MAGAAPRFWHLESFSGGIDRRDGRFTKNQNRSYDLLNMRVRNNKRMVRRPPCARNATAFVNAQGLIEWRGALYTVAKAGDAVTKPSDVTGELRFTNPDHCTSWELAGLLNFNGTPVALIKHTFPGGTVTHQFRLHVFDSKPNKPTYVEDPWCPIGWGPTLPLHAYRTGSVGAFDPLWVPRMVACSGRLYISRPDGNLAFSKTGNARTWNDRTPEDMAADGEWWYFLTNATPGTQEFIVSEPFADLFAEQKWTGFVLEYLTAEGAWTQVTEDTGVPAVDKHFRPTTVASRFAGGPDEIKLSVYWTGAAGAILRFRLVVGAPPLVVTGVTFSAALEETFSGNGATLIFQTLTMTRLSQLLIFVNNVLLGPADYTQVLVAGYVQITFAVAPSVGVGNIEVIQLPMADVAAGATISFEGALVRKVDIAYATSLAFTLGTSARYLSTIYVDSLVPVGSLFGGHTHLSTASPALTVTGQHRYNDLLVYDTQSGGGAFPDITRKGFFLYGMESAFYLVRFLEYQLNLAGDDDAGDLPTASQQGADGGYITTLSAIKDRLLVTYRGGTELWQVSGLPESHLLLSFGPVGTGDETWAEPRAVGQSVVLAMARGLMSLNLTGSNLDSMRDINLGEPIEELGFPQQADAAFWPQLGAYVTAVEMPDASRQFLAFDHSPEQKINAWSRWTVLDMPAVERFSMVPVGDKLYLRAGGYLYWFDEAATDFIDAHDPTDEAYESLWMPHFNHFDAPFRQKQALGLEWVMTGNVTVAIRWNPDMPEEETGELVYSDMTAGRAKVPVSVWGTGLAPVVRSRDRAGLEIQEVGMWFVTRGR